MEVPTPPQGRRPPTLHHRHRLQLQQVVLFLCLLVLPAQAAEWSGAVAAVKDGDTLEILRGRTPVVVRLHGIDCPELAQPFGRKAKEIASSLAFGKTVTVIERSRDRYRRTVATVILPSRENLSHALLKQGLAWWYRKYAPHDSTLRLLEEAARDRRLGLWSDPSPIPPWLWRH